MEKTIPNRRTASKALFVQRLIGYLNADEISIRSFAAQLEISHASLSRMLSGDIAISSQTVVLVCGKIGERNRSVALIEAFLLDELTAISRGLGRKHPWAREHLVTVKAAQTGN